MIGYALGGLFLGGFVAALAGAVFSSPTLYGSGIAASPLARARLDAIQLHGVLSMADDPHEDPEVIDREVESLCASILDHYRAHRRAQKENP